MKGIWGGYTQAYELWKASSSRHRLCMKETEPQTMHSKNSIRIARESVLNCRLLWSDIEKLVNVSKHERKII